MIAQLKGVVAEIIGNSVILFVSGVGYKIYTTAEVIKKIRKLKDKEIILKTHLAVRETSLDIYGFLDSEELRFFEMLISISGIGPKSAIAILNVTDTETLKDTEALTGEIDTLEALQTLGYSQKEAREAMKKIEKNISGSKNLLKEALKILGK